MHKGWQAQDHHGQAPCAGQDGRPGAVQGGRCGRRYASVRLGARAGQGGRPSRQARRCSMQGAGPPPGAAPGPGGRGCGRTGPPFSGPPKFIRNPSHFISLTQQLLVRFCLVSKNNFNRSFKQTPISSLEYETKKIYSSRLSTRSFISGRPPNFLFLPSFLVGSTEPSILS